MTNFIFSKDEAIKLFDENISVKESKELAKKADLRFAYIMETMANIIGRKWDCSILTMRIVQIMVILFVVTLIL